MKKKTRVGDIVQYHRITNTFTHATSIRINLTVSFLIIIVVVVILLYTYFYYFYYYVIHILLLFLSLFGFLIFYFYSFSLVLYLVWKKKNNNYVYEDTIFTLTVGLNWKVGLLTQIKRQSSGFWMTVKNSGPFNVFQII